MRVTCACGEEIRIREATIIDGELCVEVDVCAGEQEIIDSLVGREANLEIQIIELKRDVAIAEKRNETLERKLGKARCWTTKVLNKRAKVMAEKLLKKRAKREKERAKRR